MVRISNAEGGYLLHAIQLECLGVTVSLCIRFDFTYRQTSLVTNALDEIADKVKELDI